MKNKYKNCDLTIEKGDYYVILPVGSEYSIKDDVNVYRMTKDATEEDDSGQSYKIPGMCFFKRKRRKHNLIPKEGHYSNLDTYPQVGDIVAVKFCEYLYKPNEDDRAKGAVLKATVFQIENVLDNLNLVSLKSLDRVSYNIIEPLERLYLLTRPTSYDIPGYKRRPHHKGVNYVE